MAHVRIQGLAAGDAQHHGAQDDEGDARLIDDELHGIVRADGPQNRGLRSDVVDTQHGNGGKPHQGDGAKKFANAAGAAFLHRKQTKQNDQGQGNHKFHESG